MRWTRRALADGQHIEDNTIERCDRLCTSRFQDHHHQSSCFHLLMYYRINVLQHVGLALALIASSLRTLGVFKFYPLLQVLGRSESTKAYQKRRTMLSNS